MSTPVAFVVEPVDAASLDELRPLWEALLDRHAEVWGVLPERPAGESWERRRRQYEGWLADEGSFALVARRDGAAVGYILVGIGEGDETYATGERTAELHTLVVAAGERDAGVGGRLFDAAMERLAAWASTTSSSRHMDGNEAARRFYERRGFVPFVHLMYAQRPGAAQPRTESRLPASRLERPGPAAVRRRQQRASLARHPAVVRSTKHTACSALVVPVCRRRQCRPPSVVLSTRPPAPAT